MTLAGKRALVTGGGTGAGLAVARALASAGAEVWVAGRREGPLAAAAQEIGGRHVPCDVTSEEGVRAAFDASGSCDIVVANAGEATSGPLLKASLDDWDAMLAVNLTGTFLTFREGLRRMGPWGRLIAVASTAGLRGYAYAAPYAAAKHGVLGLVRSLALETARKGVTVNALCPGFLDTEMTDRSAATVAARTGATAAEARARLAALSPQARLVPPEEVAAAALWLCLPGSESVNGAAIALDGGASA